MKDSGLMIEIEIEKERMIRSVEEALPRRKWFRDKERKLLAHKLIRDIEEALLEREPSLIHYKWYLESKKYPVYVIYGKYSLLDKPDKDKPGRIIDSDFYYAYNDETKIKHIFTGRWMREHENEIEGLTDDEDRDEDKPGRKEEVISKFKNIYWRVRFTLLGTPHREPTAEYHPGFSPDNKNVNYEDVMEAFPPTGGFPENEEYWGF